MRFLLSALLVLLGSIGAHAELKEYGNLGGDFTLESSLNRPVSLSEFEGKVVILFFGYTSCPDICPTTMVRVQQALQRLEPDVEAQVQPLFISVDPERDTPEQLQGYVTYFHPRFIGLTGELEPLKQVARQYGAFFAKDSRTESAAGYLVAHSGYTYLVDGEGALRALYRQDAEPEEMAEDITELVDEL